jgi:integrase
MSKTMSQCVVEFSESAEFDRLADNTKRRARIVLRYLTDRAGLKTYSVRLGREHVDGVLYDARKRGLEESSLNAYRTDLRRFGKWMHARGYVPTDPAAHLENVKTSTPPSKRKPISRDQAKLLMKITADSHPLDEMTAILLLMTGLRDSEVRILKWGDANFENGTFYAYRPKLKDWHWVFWTPQLQSAMLTWKTYYEAKHGPIEPNPHWYIVPARKHHGRADGHHRMNPDWPMDPTKLQWNIGSRVKEWLAAVGEKDLKGRASHTIRRTAGNILLDSGAEPRDVQLFYGHASLAMTELYLDKVQGREKLKRKMQGFHI